MNSRTSNSVIDSVRQSLGRKERTPLPPRPPVPPPRRPGSTEAELDLLVEELNKLSGQASRISPPSIAEHLVELVNAEHVRRAVMWDTPWLRELRLSEILAACGVEIIPAYADKTVLAGCDLGITTADFALPETGTLGLLSGPDKPRAVSLLPRVHLALVPPTVLCADLHQVFAEAAGQSLDHGQGTVERFLILITGPSRTSDIELTVTLGVHGPRSLFVWIVDSNH
jgi:L-lactate dehydrogenase complex protein LldG